MYFGVPTMILPVFVDQICNGKRVEETGYGFNLPIYEYTDDQLKDCVEKLLNDENLRKKWKLASERIQREQNHNQAIEFIYNYI
jgi:UDP:flavonoid glycosyltransferase YjiC (YdhE family)